MAPRVEGLIQPASFSFVICSISHYGHALAEACDSRFTEEGLNIEDIIYVHNISIKPDLLSHSGSS